MKSMTELMAMAKSKGAKTSDVPLTEQEKVQRKADRENRMEGNLHLYDGFNCDLCKNKGYIMKAVERNGDYELVQSTCKCDKSRRSIRNLKASGLAKVLDKYSFEKFEPNTDWRKSILQTAKNFLENGNGSWFFMGGQSGAGKTHLCSAIAIEFLRRGYEVKYMLWKDDIRKIKNDNFEGGNLIEYYKNVDILYIDDLFKTVKVEGQQFQRPTQGDANLAFEIINSRLSQNKITIISSENTIYELFDIDEATAGRIKQMCGEYCLNISKGEGKNYRKRDMI